MDNRKPEENRDKFIENLEDSFDIFNAFSPKHMLRAILMNDTAKLAEIKSKIESMEAAKDKAIADYDKAPDMESKKSIVGSIKS